jgi:molybdate transport system permease protein
MDIAKTETLVLAETEKIIVYLIPAINVSRGNPKRIYSLEDLTRPGLKIGIARPDTVSTGLYAVEILEKNGVAEKVRKNIKTHAPSIAKTAQLISLDLVDAILGLRVFAYWNPDKIETVLLQPDQIPRIVFMSIAISTFSENREGGQSFIDFLLSEEGRAIYRKWGYIVTEGEARGFFPFVLFASTGLAVTLVLVIVTSQFFYTTPTKPLMALLEKDVQSAILLSLFTASVAATLGLVLAIPSAYFLARYEIWGKNLIDGILDIPIILSPVALGTALLLFSRTSPGKWIESNIIQFVFEVPGIILAQFFLAFALSLRVLKTSFESVDVRLEQVARFLGCSQWQAFSTVTLPMVRNGLIAAFILSWARAIGDFGASVTVAGAVKGKTETIPVSIYLNLASVRIEKAVALMIVIVALAAVVLILFRKLTQKKRGSSFS